MEKERRFALIQLGYAIHEFFRMWTPTSYFANKLFPTWSNIVSSPPINFLRDGDLFAPFLSATRDTFQLSGDSRVSLAIDPPSPLSVCLLNLNWWTSVVVLLCAPDVTHLSSVRWPCPIQNSFRRFSLFLFLFTKIQFAYNKYENTKWEGAFTRHTHFSFQLLLLLLHLNRFLLLYQLHSISRSDISASHCLRRGVVGDYKECW